MQNLDYKWFLDNYTSLFKTYGTCFLVIKNKNILGVYSSYAEGLKTTLKKEEIGTFIIQKCDGKDSAYTNYISSINFI